MLVKSFWEKESARLAALNAGVSAITTERFYRIIRQILAAEIEHSNIKLQLFSVPIHDGNARIRWVESREFVAIGMNYHKAQQKLEFFELTESQRRTVERNAIKEVPAGRASAVKGRFNAGYLQLSHGGKRVFVPKGAATTYFLPHRNTISNIWGWAAGILKGYRSVPVAVLQLYLAEVLWRFNKRPRNGVEVLERLLRAQERRKIPL